MQRIQDIKDTKGKGWQLKSEGGISLVNPQDERYWVGLSGVIRLDEIIYSGKHQDRGFEFLSGGHLRRTEFSVEGGIGENWEFSVDALPRGLLGNRASLILQDTWVGYMVCKNAELFFGRVSGNWYGLDGSTGSTWMPFMERSAQSFAFYPGDGIGVMGDMWWDNGGITLLATQPDQGSRIFTNDRRTFRNDRWRAVARATYAPVHCLGDVWHFGVSGVWRQNDPTLWDRILFDFSTAGLGGGLVPRNVIPIIRIFNVGALSASYANQWSVEAARQWGPFIAEAEYGEIFVHRVGNVFGSLRFKGWDVQARYTLTGEIHKYDVRDGNFGSMDICSPCGAWEVAARYDYLNLNDKDIHGGSQHNYTLALNWFINPVVRLSANYIRCYLKPNHIVAATPVPVNRKLDVIGVRLQIRFK